MGNDAVFLSPENIPFRFIPLPPASAPPAPSLKKRMAPEVPSETCAIRCRIVPVRPASENYIQQWNQLPVPTIIARSPPCTQKNAINLHFNPNPRRCNDIKACCIIS
ncbi:unnamed protein product [Didymodactylos carnosus]|uniref:Uncharacterized protein n=1 Tax=Didymodactylos carnosus TaxID=1234261 RepID=A0A815BWW2_9BILA|nr:unnamed protein product [Didymodactylos carnosus]CAF1275986.1 unnamed protein product [Didymodactylos carnosus]CAF3798319.1 unnamed protein product [Didymodactylos carnosus]CAF4067368.1 unnamed protein product [Didymodactylos carnosus]